MNLEQALEILTQATRNLNATRDQHELILQALKLLKEALQEKQSV